MESPVKCNSCDHLFCSDCRDDRVARIRDETGNQCANCHATFTESKISTLMLKMLDRTEFITELVDQVFNYAGRQVHSEANASEIITLHCSECEKGPYNSVKQLVGHLHAECV